MLRQGLLFEYVKISSREMPGSKRCNQCRFVDHFAARDVDDARTLGQLRDQFRVDEALCLRGERAADDEPVAPRQQFGKSRGRVQFVNIVVRLPAGSFYAD